MSKNPSVTVSALRRRLTRDALRLGLADILWRTRYVLVALAAECETLAAECHAAMEAPPPPRDTGFTFGSYGRVGVASESAVLKDRW